MLKSVLLGTLAWAWAWSAHARFQDDFTGKSAGNWQFFTGDGEARMELLAMDGHLRIVAYQESPA